jgi:hypothetical protein
MFLQIPGEFNESLILLNVQVVNEGFKDQPLFLWIYLASGIHFWWL